jgi:CheY-like chemotaxis protein
MARSVLLVDDVPELRSVLRQAIRLREGFTVVAEADDGVGAITAAARHQPDVIVLDLGLPDLAGHEVLTRLRTLSPASQIVVYTGSVRPDRTPLVREVEAFVTKDHDVAYLVDLLSRLTWRRHETAGIELGPDTRDVAVARRFVAERCDEWDCGDVVEDAELVVSELVTNALLHGESRCELRAELSDAALRLQVIDQGTGMPDPQSASDTDEHGRGLILVSGLCAAWGVEALPDGGKIVWAELLRPVRNPDDDRPGRSPDDASTTAQPPGRAAGASEAPGSFETAGGASEAVAVAVLVRAGSAGRGR